MPASPDSITDLELVEALELNPDLTFDLPDPEDEAVGEFDFRQRIDDAWLVCDRFDLQTEIWRGRILRAVRDKEKKGGDGRGQGFLNWLKDRELSKSQAYAWIELANSADTLMENGELSPSAFKNFSKRAFVETAKSSPEVQQLVTDAAQRGDRITRREVKQMSDEWMAMTSDLIPDEVKEQATSGATPPRFIAPLVREMEKLPETHQIAIREEIAANPDVDNIKLVTSNARSLSKYLDAGAQVQVLNDSKVDLPMALEEAMRVGCLPVAADVLKQAAQLEQTMTKFYLTWKRLGSLVDRLYVDTGASTPNLRSLIACVERLSSEIVEVPLDDTGENSIRLRVLTGE
jgi:hypothetical protein